MAECADYHELQDLEEDKGREEVQEIQKVSQAQENHSHGHDYGDDMKDSDILSRNACAGCVALTRLTERLRATLMWMSVEVVVDVRIVQCHAIMNVVIGISSCFQAVSIHNHFSLWPFFAHFCTAKKSDLRCGIYTTRRLQWTAVGCKRSIFNKVNEFKKIMP